MKRRLLLVAALVLALSAQLSKPAAAMRPIGQWDECFAENYGGGSCGTTCVRYNSQHNIVAYMTALFEC